MLISLTKTTPAAATSAQHAMTVGLVVWLRSTLLGSQPVRALLRPQALFMVAHGVWFWSVPIALFACTLAWKYVKAAQCTTSVKAAAR